MSAQSRPQRRLNRAQIQEILERNVSLYKREEHFTTYLVELALYLLEYEYDWAESGVEPPGVAQPPPPNGRLPAARVNTPAPAASRTPVPSHPHRTPVTPIAPATPPPTDTRRIVSAKLQQPNDEAHRAVSAACPYCGTDIGDAPLCPTCRNLVR